MDNSIKMDLFTVLLLIRVMLRNIFNESLYFTNFACLPLSSLEWWQEVGKPSYNSEAMAAASRSMEVAAGGVGMGAVLGAGKCRFRVGALQPGGSQSQPNHAASCPYLYPCICCMVQPCVCDNSRSPWSTVEWEESLVQKAAVNRTLFTSQLSRHRLVGFPLCFYVFSSWTCLGSAKETSFLCFCAKVVHVWVPEPCPTPCIARGLQKHGAGPSPAAHPVLINGQSQS